MSQAPDVKMDVVSVGSPDHAVALLSMPQKKPDDRLLARPCDVQTGTCFLGAIPRPFDRQSAMPNADLRLGNDL